MKLSVDLFTSNSKFTIRLAPISCTNHVLKLQIDRRFTCSLERFRNSMRLIRLLILGCELYFRDAGKDVLHYHINFDGNVHYISQKHVFHSIPEMIKYHKHNSAGATKQM